MGRTLLGALFNKVPVPYVGKHSAGSPHGGSFHRNDAEAQLRAMGQVGTLFSIVRRTSEATSQVDWKLYRKSKSGLPEDRVEVTSHAALDLWNKPNPFMTQQEFIETFQQHLDLTGEGWWITARDPRLPVPLELWPARPDRMEPVPHPEEFLSGYVYRGPGGELVPLERDEVIFLRTPNPMDPYRGMGPVQSILADLDATRYSAEWNKNFFLNSAEPGGIIEIPQALSDEDFNQLRSRWNEQHRGVANAHRVALLEHGKWVDRKFTQRDMQFAELRSVSRDVIREAFGISKAELGVVEDVNRANAEAGAAMFALRLVVPRLERIKQALNTDFLPMFGATGQGLEFDYVNPVPADREADREDLTSKANAAKALIESGVYGPSALKALGLPEMDFGQPNADPDRELLVKLVTNAPTLAPLILPLLGIELPPPEPAVSPSPPPPFVPSPDDPTNEPETAEDETEDTG
ncbi:phage portal protein [Streptomyces sp. NBC_01343]|uniref:phage portal protein n=1 Tax=Streptomyces sp. NBC_01343 TaxID=2903832 RepID=UPI002E109BA3|nr:phage portal protein [Streptomyces sp. NBC_01343]